MRTKISFHTQVLFLFINKFTATIIYDHSTNKTVKNGALPVIFIKNKQNLRKSKQTITIMVQFKLWFGQKLLGINRV